MDVDRGALGLSFDWHWWKCSGKIEATGPNRPIALIQGFCFAV
jgi:hypothetical protein